MYVELTGKVALVTGAGRKLGHDVRAIPDWANGKVMCVQSDHASGTLLAAASANGNVAYALGW